jgi:hypothetical protein
MSDQPNTITTYELNNKACPKCGAEMTDASTDAGVREPIPGDLGLCFGCGALIVFGEGRTVRLPTDEEIRHLQVEQPALWAQVEHVSRHWVELMAKMERSQRAGQG